MDRLKRKVARTTGGALGRGRADALPTTVAASSATGPEPALDGGDTAG